MKHLLLALTLLVGFSANALSLDKIVITSKNGNLFANKGGAIVPATEAVADEIANLGAGSFDCEAKFVKSSHKGTHVYTVYEIDFCY